MKHEASNSLFRKISYHLFLTQAKILYAENTAEITQQVRNKYIYVVGQEEQRRKAVFVTH